MRKLIVAGLLGVFAVAACADERVMEILTLKHRLVGDVLPTLQQLVAQGGTVTGMHDQLIIRTTPDNLADLKQVLAALDTRARQLRITVRQDIDAETRAREDALSARIRAGDISAGVGRPRAGPGAQVSIDDGENRLTYNALSTRGVEDTAHTHFVTTLEGRAAWINAGQAVPVANRSLVYGPYGPLVQDSVTLRDVGAGFYVTPRVIGAEGVSLEISPYADNLDSRGGGAIDTRGLSTAVSGRLGEWIPLGGAAQSINETQGVDLYRTRRSGADRYDVWVKVDLAP